MLFYYGIVIIVDLYGDSLEYLERSIRKIYMLPDETIAYLEHEIVHKTERQ